MDYGKLAYLKAVDLESRLSSIGRGDKIAVSVAELKDIPSGKSDVAVIEGTGDIAVFASCSCEAVFYVGGVRVCEGKDVFFKIAESGKISVSSETPIASLRILALGYIAYSDVPTEVQADCNGKRVGYVVCGNGRVSAYISAIEPFEPAEYFVGDFVQGDICLRGGKVILAFVNSKGAIVIFEEGRRYFYHAQAEKVAINADDFSVTVAYLSGGQLYYFAVDKLWDPRPRPTPLGYSGFIDDFKLVKRDKTLVFSSGGKCYVKELPSFGSGKDKLYIALKAEKI